jgi:hypothetical protein
MCRVCAKPGRGFEEPIIDEVPVFAETGRLYRLGVKDRPGLVIVIDGPTYDYLLSIDQEHCADDQPHVEKDSHTLPCDLCTRGIPMTRYHASGHPLDLPDHEVFWETQVSPLIDLVVEHARFKDWRDAKLTEVAEAGEAYRTALRHRVGEPTEHEHPQTTMLREGLENDRARREERERLRGGRPRTPTKVIEDWSDFGKKDVL